MNDMRQISYYETMIQPVSTPIICENRRKEPKTHHTFPWYQYNYGIVSRN